jgi:multidrug efflux pump subunit AcrA (membrane-fusion protein)
MARANGATTIFEKWRTVLTGAAVLAATVVSLFSISARVQGVQNRLDFLEQQMHRVDAIETRIDRVQREARALSLLRQDILQAICAANARNGSDLRRCVARAN